MADREYNTTSGSFSKGGEELHVAFGELSVYRHRRRREHCGDQSRPGIASLQVAEMADVTILVADIDRGGSLPIVGARELLSRMGGSASKVLSSISSRRSFAADSGISSWRRPLSWLGVVPSLRHFRIPEEDSVALEKPRSEKREEAKVIGLG
jgi:hypothetical protein